MKQKIIALANQKGGVSKSTSAIHLAYWLKKKGYKVLLVDADGQRSSSQWLKDAEFTIDSVVLSDADQLLDKLGDLAQKNDYVVIDGGANLAETTRAILLVCDLAIVPVQPTGVDLRSTNDTLKIVKQAQRVRGGEPPACLFLSRAVKGTVLKNEAIEYLKSLESKGINYLNSVIHQKQIIADTSGQNSVVFEISGRAAKDSAREFNQLFKEILEVME